MWWRCTLTIGLVVAIFGCDASPGVTPKASGTSPSDPSDEVEAAIDTLDDADSVSEYRAALDGLEKALQKDPANLDGLTAFWENMREFKTAGGKIDYRIYRRAADLLRRAQNANRRLADQADFQVMAADVFYNDACAKGVEQKPAEAVAALREAVGFGWEDLELLSQDADLASVRDTAEYKKFFTEAKKIVAAARQARKDAMVADVVQEMEQTTPFEFSFDVEDVKGNRISKAGFAGKVLIVDFWGTWCRPCLKELPHFITLYEKYHDRGLEIVGFNSEGNNDNADETKTLVREFIETRNLPYPCALLTDEVSEQVPDLDSLPTTLFFDRTGKLRLRADNYNDLLKLEVVVEQLLKESGS
jgi:thiol-disulfide isomerase/thioredoxin